MKGLTIVYITARKEPMFEWFADSLIKQYKGDFALEVVMVDLWHSRGRMLEFQKAVSKGPSHIRFTYPELLPSFCQGYFRLTKEEWFDAAIARNTGLVYAQHGYVAFVDDVSVLMPGWLDAVLEGERKQRIILGAYQKHTLMSVEKGRIIYSHVELKDIDSRWQYGGETAVRGHASWFYGCSFAMPLDLALEVNGFDEMGAMIGQEDCCFGMRLEKYKNNHPQGSPSLKKGGEFNTYNHIFYYDRRMFTIESIEHHTNDVVMKRFDPEGTQEQYYALLDKYGLAARPVYPRYDASHFQLDIIRHSTSYQSYLNGFDLRRLRLKAEKGETIGVKDMGFPEKFWFDGRALKDL